MWLQNPVRPSVEPIPDWVITILFILIIAPLFAYSVYFVTVTVVRMVKR